MREKEEYFSKGCKGDIKKKKKKNEQLTVRNRAVFN